MITNSVSSPLVGAVKPVKLFCLRVVVIVFLYIDVQLCLYVGVELCAPCLDKLFHILE